MPYLVIVELAPPSATPSGSFDEQWETAVAAGQAQQSFAPVEALYAANTGHEALGISEADLVDGSLVSEFDGQVFEGIRGSVIRCSHSGVRYLGCRVVDGGQYGAYGNPTFGAPITDVRIEYCTYEYSQLLTEHHRANLWYPAENVDTVTLSHCNMHGWSSGGQYGAGVTVEYCWMHDWQTFTDIHSSGISHNRTDMKSYRNYVTDGTSGCCTLYFDREPVHRVTMQENILNGSSPQASPSYLINMKGGEHAAPATDVKIIGNLLGPEFQFGPMSGAEGLVFGQAGNEMTGNVWFLTGEPV